MFKNFIYLGLLLQFSKQPNILAFQPITENNHVLVGHIFQQLSARDWFNCIQACHDEPRFISYNYQRSAGNNGLCELNECGVEDLCDKEYYVLDTFNPGFQRVFEPFLRVFKVFPHSKGFQSVSEFQKLVQIF